MLADDYLLDRLDELEGKINALWAAREDDCDKDLLDHHDREFYEKDIT